MYSDVTCMTSSGHAMYNQQAVSQMEEVKVIKSSCRNVGNNRWFWDLKVLTDKTS